MVRVGANAPVGGDKGVAVYNNSAFRTLRIGMGVLWLLDALLQLQPGMFDKAFYGNLPASTMPSLLQTVRESAVGPAASAVQFTQSLYSHTPVVVNLFVIVIQLILAALLLLPVGRGWVRAAAVGTVVWGLAVWLFGEGLAGLPALGDMTFYSGFPGSAFFYTVAGVALLFPQTAWQTGRAQRTAQYALVVILGACALLQVLPENLQWHADSLMNVFANSGFQRQPALLSNPVMAFSLWISGHAILANTILSAALAGATIALLFWRSVPRLVRIAVYVWVFLSWWFGMDFGYIFSGLSTDPNSGPAVGLLAFTASMWKSASDKTGALRHDRLQR
ncbi:hypothetical protein [Alicyclobacillus sp. ALC3]|uniref:hypothetical protein n=1 Tax=Alicyclobacillus sp. ALC3 TaxID=2796143 RepID=UPI0023787BA2|nr:hypothetical protein [Alicyclobacillus sp. ALC3]WDL99248.1 hypothetical protein JC200_11710 [Alicyclobacillus sp. ALC3]